jgi:hypothetical protein
MARQQRGGAPLEERLKAWAIMVGILIPFCFLAGIVGEIAGTYLNTGFVVVALLSGVCLLGFYFIVRRQVSIITRDKTRDFIYFFCLGDTSLLFLWDCHGFIRFLQTMCTKYRASRKKM